jgi:hypothetical protein
MGLAAVLMIAALFVLALYLVVQFAFNTAVLKRTHW